MRLWSDMLDRFKKSGKIGCFIAIHPPISFHLAEFDEQGAVQRLRSSQQSEMWINGGYFIFRNKIFDYIRDGEELVLEPFKRLIEGGQLMAYKYEGFWRAMDTLRDRQVLEEMVERGEMPWHEPPHVTRRRGRMKACSSSLPAIGCRFFAWVRIRTTSRSEQARRSEPDGKRHSPRRSLVCA